MEKDKKSYGTNLVAFLILTIISIGIVSFYPKIKEWAKEEPLATYENYELLINIYKSNYVLYKDLLEQKNSEELTSDSIYIKSYEESENSHDDIKKVFNYQLDSWENDLNNKLKNLDYLIYEGNDPINSINKTNTDSDLSSLINNTKNVTLNNKYSWYMVIKYDENGGVSINNVHGGDDYKIRNRFSEFTVRDAWDYSIIENNNIKFNPIKNVTFIYGIPKDLKYLDTISRIVNESLNSVNLGIISRVVIVILCSILILGLILPYRIGKNIFGIRIFLKIPFEINFIIFGFSAIFLGLISANIIIETLQNMLIQDLIGFVIATPLENFIIFMVNIIVWIITAYFIFAGDMMLKYIFSTGLIKYLKENLLIIKILKLLN